MTIKIFLEILQGTLQRLHGAGRQGAKSMSRPQEAGVSPQAHQILGLSPAVFNRREDAGRPGQSFPAGRSPATGLPGKKLHQILHQADRTGLVVKNDDGAGAQPAAGLLGAVEIHPDIQV
jgi:hypothetical protein